MPIRKYKPTSAGRRLSSVEDFSSLTKTEPLKKFLIPKKKQGGRNSQGKITIRHRGGGAKQKIRLIDFLQEKFSIPAMVETIEYDPNRGARIARVLYQDGERRYILAPDTLQIGQKVLSSKQRVDIQIGNRMPLEFIPIGTMVHNIELRSGEGGKMARSAGNSASLMAVEGGYAQLRMPSSEIRLIAKECLASVGQVGHPEFNLVRWGKAGRIRRMGIRPTVRGKAMNPVDHPHGGGEGRSPIGLKNPKTLWGKPALGVKTRKRGKWSDRFILSRRKK